MSFQESLVVLEDDVDFVCSGCSTIEASAVPFVDSDDWSVNEIPSFPARAVVLSVASVDAEGVVVELLVAFSPIVLVLVLELELELELVDDGVDLFRGILVLLLSTRYKYGTTPRR
jgi:hypothetical protein